jgi:oligo-1,6-glucosidase
MTNVAFAGIDEYRDVATLNYYRERIAAGEAPGEILPRIHECGRDNARTPVQWSAERYAGFSTHEPWIGVNPDYTTVNVESELANPDSVLHYYRRLIALRKEHPVIVYGDFNELADQEIPVFAFERRLDATVLTTVLNLSNTDAVAVVPDQAGPPSACLELCRLQAEGRADTASAVGGCGVDQRVIECSSSPTLGNIRRVYSRRSAPPRRRAHAARAA